MAENDIHLRIGSEFNAAGFNAANNAVKTMGRDMRGATKAVVRATASLGEMQGAAGKVASSASGIATAFMFGGIVAGAAAIANTAINGVFDHFKEGYKKVADEAAATAAKMRAAFDNAFDALVSEARDAFGGYTKQIRDMNDELARTEDLENKDAKAAHDLAAANDKVAAAKLKAATNDPVKLAELGVTQTAAAGQRSVEDAEVKRMLAANALHAIEANAPNAMIADQLNAAGNLHNVAAGSGPAADKAAKAEEEIYKRIDDTDHAYAQRLALARNALRYAEQEKEVAKRNAEAGDIAAKAELEKAKAEEDAADEAAHDALVEKELARQDEEKKKAVEEHKKAIEKQIGAAKDAKAAAAEKADADLAAAKERLADYLKSQVGVAGVAFRDVTHNDRNAERAARDEANRKKNLVTPGEGRAYQEALERIKHGWGTDRDRRLVERARQWRRANDPAELAKRQAEVDAAKRAAAQVSKNFDMKLSDLSKQLAALGLK